MPDASLQDKLEHMREILRSLQRVTVAFSAGVDSTFLLKVALDTLGPSSVVAVTGRSPSVAARELEDARRLARSMGVRHLVIETDEFDNPKYLANPTDRCYFCKTALYERMKGSLSEAELGVIVSGTNADDLGDHRPGLSAAREQSVRAPCAEAGLTKDDIRALSAEMGLPTSNKAASPCLSSRVPYGESITPDKLKMIEQAEDFLRTLLESLPQESPSFAGEQRRRRDCRVRSHDRLARIEVPPEFIQALAKPDVRTKIEAALRKIGYHYVTLDLRGFRSGSLNEVIAFGKRQ